MWDTFVELLRAAIVGAAHLCGGSLGGGILVVSAGIRLALLPLTLRLARRAREQQARIAAIRPELEALQRRFAKDQRRLIVETRELYRAHDIKLFTPTGMIGLAVQVPLLSGLFAAVRTGLGTKVRFLWVADLARPEGLLALVVTSLTAWSVSSMPPSGAPAGATTAMVLVMVVGTIVFLFSASSAVALSMGAGSLVSILQNWILARETRQRTVTSGN
jgi:YidC/Oxa1 family membrane protein insertase